MDWLRVGEAILLVLSIATGFGLLVRWLLNGVRDRIIWEVEDRTAPLRENGGQGLADVPQRLDEIRREQDAHAERNREQREEIGVRLDASERRLLRLEDRQIEIANHLGGGVRLPGGHRFGGWFSKDDNSPPTEGES